MVCLSSPLFFLSCDCLCPLVRHGIRRRCRRRPHPIAKEHHKCYRRTPAQLISHQVHLNPPTPPNLAEHFPGRRFESSHLIFEAFTASSAQRPAAAQVSEPSERSSTRMCCERVSFKRIFNGCANQRHLKKRKWRKNSVGSTNSSGWGMEKRRRGTARLIKMLEWCNLQSF